MAIYGKLEIMWIFFFVPKFRGVIQWYVVTFSIQTYSQHVTRFSINSFIHLFFSFLLFKFKLYGEGGDMIGSRYSIDKKERVNVAWDGGLNLE